jgi:hypothetical protein
MKGVLVQKVATDCCKKNNDPVVQIREVQDKYCVSVVVNWKVALEI